PTSPPEEPPGVNIRLACWAMAAASTSGLKYVPQSRQRRALRGTLAPQRRQVTSLGEARVLALGISSISPGSSLPHEAHTVSPSRTAPAEAGESLIDVSISWTSRPAVQSSGGNTVLER